VTRPFHRDEGRIDTRLFQRGVKQLALSEGHRSIPVAVHDEKRRRVFRNVGHRAGPGRVILVFQQRPADEL